MEEMKRKEEFSYSNDHLTIPVLQVPVGSQVSRKSQNYSPKSPPFTPSSSGGSHDSNHQFSNVELHEVSIAGDTTASAEFVQNIPTLDKVLLGESGAPLSISDFYSYLREHWRAEDNLNFWLDVTKHENLWNIWREHEKRKKEREIQYKYYDDKDEEDSEEDDELDEDSQDEFDSSDYRDSRATANTADSRNPVIDEAQSRYRRQINEEDLHDSAKQIYQKYALLNIFPEENRATMQDLILRQGRYNPVVFSSSKSYVYHIMNVIYFPKFVESAIDMNLTQLHAIISLPLGMLGLTCGIALELYFIFMGWPDRLIRLWGLIPVWLGWLFLQTAVTRFLPLLTLLGVSERKLFRFQRIREKAVQNAHRARALQFSLYSTLVSLLCIGILIVIPPVPLNNLSNLD